MTSTRPRDAPRLIAGVGTPESTWRPWLDRQPWPELDLTTLVPGDRPLVVLAAHPDDEVLATGGLLRHLAAAGRRPTVVWATDGEASHPGSSAVTPDELRRRRAAESAEAFRRLGVAHQGVRLCLPDGGLDVHADLVADALFAHSPPGAVLLAPWRRDGHPDHDACGRAAAAVAGRPDADVLLIEYPVWAWHWSRPADQRVPWADARRVRLDDAMRAAKAHAVAAYDTQIRDLGTGPADAAVLPPPVLERFDRPFETVFVAERAR